MTRKITVALALLMALGWASLAEPPQKGTLKGHVTINHPPTIKGLTFAPSKFINSCEGVVACATASDPEGQDVAFEWNKLKGPDLIEAPQVVSHGRKRAEVTECVLVKTGLKGKVGMKVTVYDQASGEGNSRPHDDLEFPLYAGVNCPKAP